MRIILLFIIRSNCTLHNNTRLATTRVTTATTPPHNNIILLLLLSGVSEKTLLLLLTDLFTSVYVQSDEDPTGARETRRVVNGFRPYFFLVRRVYVLTRTLIVFTEPSCRRHRPTNRAPPSQFSPPLSAFGDSCAWFFFFFFYQKPIKLATADRHPTPSPSDQRSTSTGPRHSRLLVTTSLTV